MKTPPAGQSEKIIDGKAVAAALRSDLARQVAEFRAQTQIQPGLAVVIVGDDPASHIYVRKKGEACREIGMQGFEHRLAGSTSEAALRDLILKLNQDPSVHGILVQLPLPAQINSDAILSLVNPMKDVDGFHPENTGLLSQGKPRFAPCTPLGMMKLLAAYHINPQGLEAVVVGRSNIVGKPIAQLLLNASATVSICHSKTKDLAAHLRTADLVVAAIGKPEFIQGNSLKKDCVVLDVGINRLPTGKIVGDVHFASAIDTCRLITPVPGGVGPMTIACLLDNTLRAARLQAEQPKGKL